MKAERYEYQLAVSERGRTISHMRFTATADRAMRRWLAVCDVCPEPTLNVKLATARGGVVRWRRANSGLPVLGPLDPAVRDARAELAARYFWRIVEKALCSEHDRA